MLRAGAGRVVQRALSSSGLDLASSQSVLRMLAGPESERNLERFSKFEGAAFAVIKVGGEVVRDELDLLATSCSLLHRLGLKPIVIHGGGPQLNAELASDGVEPKYVRGNRVTDAATLRVAERVFTGLNADIAAALEAMGTPAAAFPRGVFNAEVADPELGFVGEITGLNSEAVLAGLAEGRVPVLTSLGSSASGQLLNINADVAAREMAVAVRPMKVVFTSAKGGWTDDDTGEIVDVVDLTRQYEPLAARDYTGRQGTLLKLNEINLLLSDLPRGSSVTISSAAAIARSLFSTEAGHGTVFVRGEPVLGFESVGQLDLVKLGNLLEAGGAPPGSPAFFERLQVLARGIYATPSLSSCAIVSEGTPPVLERFAVAEELKGTGAAEALWEAVRADFPALQWRGEIAAAGARLSQWADGGDGDGDLFWCGEERPPAAEAPPAAPATADDPRVASWDNVVTPTVPMSGPKYKVGLLGARGYVGREFVRLLVQHPNLELVLASSRALKGDGVAEAFGLDPAAADAAGVDKDLKFVSLEPDAVEGDAVASDVDVWVLALPNGLAPPFVEPLTAGLESPPVLIDLGADYRFDSTWAYGLPERPGARGGLRGARLISNPGCYATGGQVGLMPLFEGDSPLGDPGVAPSIFGVSGYSGAGTTPSPKNDPVCLKDNLLPYALAGHIHEREVSRHLGTRVGFMPHVAPFFQGISLTITAQLKKDQSTGVYPSAEQVETHYRAFYNGEPLIKVLEGGAYPEVRDNMHQHYVQVGGFTVDQDSGRVALVATIDNLLKGAASQALQNINLALGIPELTGLGIDGD